MNLVEPFSHLDPLRKEIAQAMLAQKIKENASLKQSAIDKIAKVRHEITRRSYDVLSNFVRAAWHVVQPTTPLVWTWHLDALCNVLMSSIRTPNERTIINVPPGTMKSLLVSVMLRAYLWREDPSLRFLTGSYGAHLSIRDNVRVRDIVTSPWYQSFWPHVQLTDDVNRKERFDTTARGWSIATSVGGIGTGEHPHYIIIDDPITEQQSRSKADRDSANAWIDKTLSTRGVVLGARTLLIMQRFHEEDPTGHLLEKGGWEHVKFPMRFETVRYSPETGEILSQPDPRDLRKTEGELLCPLIYDEQKVRKLELDLESSAAGQLQQRPSAEAGNFFRREWFTILDTLPNTKRRTVRGWDVAATEGGGDYTCGVRLSEDAEGNVYVEDMVYEQLGPAGVDRLILNTAKLDGKSVMQREERDPGSAGKSVIAQRTRLLRGFDYDEVLVSQDKQTRAKPFRSQAAAGNVFVLRALWTPRYINLMTAFPAGKEDHPVDATSCAYNSIVSEPAIASGATW